ncbi:MAG: protein-disulfide reductase DsbD family protein, partial [Flavobacteriales bacterium]
MKKVIILLTFVLSTNVFSQIYDPVKWSTSVQKISDIEYNLIATATIESGWHLYSQVVPEGGPIPTTFTFIDSKHYSLVNKTQEEEGHEVDDSVFEMRIKFFENKAEFKQRVIVLNDINTIDAEVEFMVCDDEKCLPPNNIDLAFKIASNAVTNITAVDKVKTAVEEKGEAKYLKLKKSQKKEKSKGLLGTFLIAFLFGFTALLTPCVFPMIPMTVSFFTKQSKNKAQGIRNAIIFGISIVVIYVLLGTVITAIFGASALNALATNVWFNIIFFLLLVIFAVSFLGAFELTLPSSWGTKVDAQADKGGLVGIFFMALALAIVSFSCTGPIVGSILVEAASGGNQIGPIIGMLGFSLAIA